MTVIAEYTVSADDFVLGRAAVPDVGVELERLFPDDDGSVTYFWAGGDADDFERSLRTEPAVEEFHAIDDFDGRRFYRGLCDSVGESLVEALGQFAAGVLAAEGDHERWEFRVEFRDGATVSTFQDYCIDAADVDLELERLYNPVDAPPRRQSELTPRQRETLLTAYREGYFDIPRKITLVDLARELDVSDQAISERLRRGESKLIRSHLLDE